MKLIVASVQFSLTSTCVCRLVLVKIHRNGISELEKIYNGFFSCIIILPSFNLDSTRGKRQKKKPSRPISCPVTISSPFLCVDHAADEWPPLWQTDRARRPRRQLHLHEPANQGSCAAASRCRRVSRECKGNAGPVSQRPGWSLHESHIHLQSWGYERKNHYQ